VVTNLLGLTFGGWRPYEHWIAIGAGFMAVPAHAEVDRLRTKLATASPRGRVVASLLRPVRAVTWVFDRFDAITTQLNFPAMLSRGRRGGAMLYSVLYVGDPDTDLSHR
jgi:hypothetical protein